MTISDFFASSPPIIFCASDYGDMIGTGKGGDSGYALPGALLMEFAMRAAFGTLMSCEKEIPAIIHGGSEIIGQSYDEAVRRAYQKVIPIQFFVKFVLLICYS